MLSAVRRSLVILGAGYSLCTLLACTGNVPQDFAGQTPSEVGKTVTAAVTAQSGGTVKSAGGSATVSVPPGALSMNTNITVAVKAKAQAPTPEKLLSNVYDLGPTGTQFTQPVTLAFQASSPPSGQKAVLAFLNPQNAWQVVPNSSYDPNAMTVSGQVSHFTDFAVIYVAANGNGCAQSPDPNAYCSPLLCDSGNDTCYTPPPAPTSFLVGGTLVGLSGDAVVLENNGGDLLTLSQNGNFTFDIAQDDATTYLVAVAQQPNGQWCSISGGVGTIATADVTGVVVTCQPAYNVGGSVTNLIGSVTLQNGNTQVVVNSSSPNFIMANLPTGSIYNVTVQAQPLGQNCVVQNGSGSVGNSDIFNINVQCAYLSYALGGQVAGLVADASVTLENGPDTIVIANGSYTFPTNISYNESYSVSIVSPTGQDCEFAANVSGQGTMVAAPINSINIQCQPLGYALSGSVSGLLDGTQLTLQSGNDTLTVLNGDYNVPTPIAYTSNYNIVISAPPGQVCVAASPNTLSGVMPANNLGGLDIVCSLGSYPVGGTITGLVANTNVTLSNGADTLYASPGAYAFPTLVTYMRPYAVSIVMSPPFQSCAFTDASTSTGTMGPGGVSNVDITCTAQAFSLSGSVSGLADGTQVTLQNGNDTLTLTNGNFNFPTAVPYGNAYVIGVQSPDGQTCAFTSVDNGNSVMPAADVNDLTLVCAPTQYPLGGTITGLVANTNVTLSNGSDHIAVSNGNYTFPTLLVAGANYAVSLTAPLAQTCTFTPGGVNAGSMVAGGFAGVNITCAPSSYRVSGSVSGLIGASSVGISDDADIVNVVNGSWSFPTPVAYGATLTVNVNPPLGQSCVFADGNTTFVTAMGHSDLGGINLTCSPVAYPVGGTVTGLVGAANVTLQNGNDVLSVSNGGYAFPTNVAYNSNYNVTLTSPAGQACVFTGASSGTMGAAAITNVGVSCASNAYGLSGVITGLLSGTNVTVRQGADSITVANGNYSLPTAVAFGTSYSITVSQPVGQSCVFGDGNTFSNGVMGASSISNANISCSPSLYTVGGNISGLVANTNVILQNGNDTLLVSNGRYVFPTSVAYGASYSATLTSPGGEVCSFSGVHSGTMGAGNVTNVDIFCTGMPYPLGGRVSGLVNGTTVTLRNGGDSINVGNGNFTFPTQVVYNTSYSASLASPVGQTCNFSPASISVGTMPAGAVTNINVSCGPQTYTLGGTVSGLVGSANVTLQNGSDTIVVGNGAFTFDVGLAFNTSYAVSLTSPSGQTCAFVGATSGTMGAANVSSLSVSCQAQAYALGGSVTGLVGGGQVTLQNGSDSIAVGNGSYTFPTQVAFNAPFAASLVSPSGQSCTFSPANSNVGVMPAAAVTSVNVTCGQQTYALGGIVSGLSPNAQLQLQNGNDSISVTNGSYSFPTGLAFNSGYNATLTPPSGQSCVFTGAAQAGVMGAANISNLNVACSAQSFSVGGTVTGLVGNTNVTLQQGADTLSVGNGNFTFPTLVAFGGTYNATLASPAGQFCAFSPIGSNTGTMPANAVTSVQVVCGAQTYALGGSVSGLVPNTNVTLANGNDAIAAANGLYTFPTALPYGTPYSVSLTSPSGQSCAFVGGHVGTMGASNVTNIGVNCTPLNYSLGGQVSGLVGSGTVTLQNGGDSISVANGNYTFPTQQSYSSPYTASLTSPAGQTCVFVPAGVNAGTMPASAVNNINVSCGPQTYSIGGSVNGLLANTNVTLQNGNDTISVGNGGYTFPTGLAFSAGYAVSVVSPTGQVCSFLGAHAGTMGAANVSNIGLSCSPQNYNLGGVVTGILGSGTVSLQNGGDNIALGNGSYTFPSSVAFNSNYAATLISPAGQTCVFSPPSVSSGTMPAGNVNNINVSCGPQTYTLGGQVSGLVGGTQVTLQNGNDTITVSNGSYTFPTGLAFNAGYTVGVTSPLGQSCAFSGGHTGTMGAANVSNISVSCSPQSFNLGGTVTGIIGSATVSLQNGSDNVAVGNGAYTFPSQVAFNSNYSVSLVAPAGQSCVFSPPSTGAGTMGAGDVNTIDVSCGPQTYTLGGTVSGLVSSANVTLQNGNDSIAVGNGAFTFPTGLPFNTDYNAIAISPTGETCVFTSGHNGTMGAANISTLRVSCSTQSFVLGGTVSGLVGSSVVELQNGADAMSMTNGTYTFATPVPFGSAFSASVMSPPGQDCEFDPVGSNLGTMPGFDVATLNVVCAPLGYSVGGSVAGLLGNSNISLQNGLDTIVVGNGSYTFPTPVGYGSSYAATLTSPAGQTCAFGSDANGVVGAANVTTLAVNCGANNYVLGGSVSGLVSGTQVSLQNGADTVTVGNGNYSFPTLVAYNSNYLAQMTSPAGQTCTFSPTDANVGSMPASDVTTLNVVCGSQTYSLGGSVAGLLPNSNVTLQSGADLVTVGNGAYTFPTLLLYSAAYNVSITSPAGQSCTFDAASSGTMGAGNVNNINLTCVPSGFNLGGSVSGLVAGAQVSLQNGNDTLSVGNGNYQFPTQVAYQGGFDVAALAPAGMSCGFSPSDANVGVMPAGDFNQVSVVCTALPFNLGGHVTGLVTNANLTVQNGADTLTVGNGAYAFPTQVAYNGNFSVTLTAPAGQSCAFVGVGSGLMPASDLDDIDIACVASGFALGGSVAGLADGTQLTLQNGNDTVQAGNGNFVFPTLVSYQSDYAIALTSPNGQFCAFSPADSNAGTMPANDVTNLQVSCGSQSFVLGGTVSGLVSGANVTLQNGNDVLTLGNGDFIFPTGVPFNAQYTVSITSPAGQSCAFSPAGSGAGTMPAADTNTVDVVCGAQTYALGGSVSGLLSGTQVTLQNGNDALILGNGAYSFPTALPFGSTYAATLISPAGQSCTYAGSASGTMGAGDVTNLDVTCTLDAFNLGGTVSGLADGTQVTLQNGSDSIQVGNGTFTFPTQVSYNANWLVTLASPDGQSCALDAADANGGVMAGADITTLSVTCGAQSFALGGQVSGLLDGTEVTLQNGNDSLSVGNGNYTFPTALAFGSGYSATLESPDGQSCSFSQNANGTMGTGDITDLNVTCTQQSYTLGGNVSGLQDGTQVTLQNGNDTIQVANGGFSFPTQVSYNANWLVTVVSPAGQSCMLDANDIGGGVMGNANVATLSVSCSSDSFALGGSVSGLLDGTQVALQNGNDTLSVGNGSYTFATPIAAGGNYSATLSSPNGQSCSFVVSATGTMGTADVTNLDVSCSVQSYTLGGNVTGLQDGTQVTLQNGNDTIQVANGGFSFPTQVSYNANWLVTVASPAGQSCMLDANDIGGGVMGDANVTTLSVSCSSDSFALGGSVSGLLDGTQVALQNGNDTLSVGNGSYTFATPIASGGNYSATLSSPNGQSCSFVVSATGTMGTADVTNLDVSCSLQSYTLGGNVSGLQSGTQVTLQNGNDTIQVENGGFSFPTQVAYNANWLVTVVSPAGQSCMLDANDIGGGVMGDTNSTTLSVSCSANSFVLGGSVSGLQDGTQVALQNGNDTLSVGNGNYSFPTPVTAGGNYAVTLTSPAGQACAFTPTGVDSGTMPGADNNSVTVVCSGIAYAVGGSVTGLVSGGSVVLGNGNDTLEVDDNVAFNFQTSVADQSSYAATVVSQPDGQQCTINGATGTVDGGNVTSLAVVCSSGYTVTVTVSGLAAGASLGVTDGSEAMSLDSNDVSGTFSTALFDGDTYNIQVIRQPAAQSCSLDLGSGTIADQNVVVMVNCVTALSFAQQQSATTVIGQLDFVSNSNGVDDSTTSGPLGAVYLAPTGDLYLADTAHMRIVGYHQGVPADPGTPFDFEIGQGSLFASQSWVTPDANTYYPRTITGNSDVLVTTDGYDNRVMIIQTFPETTVDADVVLGQPDFVSNGAGCAATALNGPRGASVTSDGHLLVADALNNRVLIWNSLPTSNGQAADLALGQPDLSTCVAAGTNASTAATLNNPWDVWSDGNHVLVADTNANRVLVWNSFPTAIGQLADAVIGQPDMSTNVAGDMTTSLGSPSAVVSDGTSIFIAEYDNMRVGQWSGLPWQNNQATLGVVLGQPDTSTANCDASGGAPADNSLCQVGGLSIVGTQLIVADTVNNRYMVFQSQ